MTPIDINADSITVHGAVYERLCAAAGVATRWGRVLDDETYVEIFTPMTDSGNIFYASIAIRGEYSDSHPPEPHAQGRTPEEAIDNLILDARAFAAMVEALGGKR